MGKIDKITVEGFKSIASIRELELRPINVIIGANGSGKSNFIGVFSFLRAIREDRLQEYVLKAGGADRILHFGRKTTGEIKIQTWFEEEKFPYQITLQPTESDELIPSVEKVEGFWDKSAYSVPTNFTIQMNAKEAWSSISNHSRISTNLGAHLDSWRIYHFHDTSVSSPMKTTADINDNRYLRSDGSNLASFLYLLRVKHEAQYSLIRRTIQQVTPFFDDFSLEPQRLNPNKIRLEWKHKRSDAYFDASSLSDGTLRFMALATLLLQPEEYRPSIILIDEPELGLHPYAITMLSSLVKQASVKTQVILSTQSALLLDHFQPEDILVAELVDGGTQLSRLDPEKLEAWLEDYSLGQLWEKNELGGRPRPEGSYVQAAHSRCGANGRNIRQSFACPSSHRSWLCQCQRPATRQCSPTGPSRRHQTLGDCPARPHDTSSRASKRSEINSIIRKKSTIRPIPLPRNG